MFQSLQYWFVWLLFSQTPNGHSRWSPLPGEFCRRFLPNPPLREDVIAKNWWKILTIPSKLHWIVKIIFSKTWFCYIFLCWDGCEFANKLNWVYSISFCDKLSFFKDFYCKEPEGTLTLYRRIWWRRSSSTAPKQRHFWNNSLKWRKCSIFKYLYYWANSSFSFLFVCFWVIHMRKL